MKPWHMHWPVRYRNWTKHMIETDEINNNSIQCLVVVPAAAAAAKPPTAHQKTNVHYPKLRSSTKINAEKKEIENEN